MSTKEMVGDIKEAVNERIRNPFVITFIISWLAWNWLLVYEMYSFSDKIALQAKVKIVNDYIQKQLWCNLTIWPLFSALIATLVYLGASALWTFLFSYYDRTIKPAIYNKTAKGENIPRKLYDLLKKRYAILETDYEESKQLWKNYETEIQTLSADNRKLNKEHEQLKKQKEHLDGLLKTSDAEKKDLLTKVANADAKSREMKLKFTSVFRNKKIWVAYKDFTKQNSSTTPEKLRFEDDSLVKNENGRLIYETSNEFVSDDLAVFTFKLSMYDNLDQHKTIYLINLGNNTFMGVEYEGTGKRRPVFYSCESNKTPQNIPD